MPKTITNVSQWYIYSNIVINRDVFVIIVCLTFLYSLVQEIFFILCWLVGLLCFYYSCLFIVSIHVALFLYKYALNFINFGCSTSMTLKDVRGYLFLQLLFEAHCLISRQFGSRFVLRKLWIISESQISAKLSFVIL